MGNAWKSATSMAAAEVEMPIILEPAAKLVVVPKNVLTADREAKVMGESR